VGCAVLVLGATAIHAKERAPLADETFDGGSPSAEVVGRGNTYATGTGNPASGSLNPAALGGDDKSYLYATALVHTGSKLPDDEAEATDPLSGRVLRYLAMASGKGTFFYEPLARNNEFAFADPVSPSPMDGAQVAVSADALGFAGADRVGAGNIGLSISYLHASLAEQPYAAGAPGPASLDTADGLRMNFGLRYPTGPVLWGATIQNAPAFLWWKDHRREQLPLRFRVGNAWRIQPGTVLSLEAESRYYHEGSRKENFFYAGIEMAANDAVVLRVGAFADKPDDPETRHYTGGVTVQTSTEVRLTYALEQFRLDKETVRQSFVSVGIPFIGGDAAK
jgi:hypothetical protein